MPTTLDDLAGTGQLVFELLLPELVQLAHHLQAGCSAGHDEQGRPRAPALPRAHCSICSGEAAWPIVERANAGITIANPIPAQPQNSSSMNIGSDRPVGSPIRSR